MDLEERTTRGRVASCLVEVHADVMRVEHVEKACLGCPGFLVRVFVRVFALALFSRSLVARSRTIVERFPHLDLKLSLLLVIFGIYGRNLKM